MRRVVVASATACPAMSGANGRTKWSARPNVEKPSASTVRADASSLSLLEDDPPVKPKRMGRVVMLGSSSHLGGQPGPTVDADHLAVEVGVGDDQLDERGVLVRLPDALRERHVANEELLHLRRGQAWGLERPRGYGAHP